MLIILKLSENAFITLIYVPSTTRGDFHFSVSYK